MSLWSAGHQKVWSPRDNPIEIPVASGGIYNQTIYGGLGFCLAQVAVCTFQTNTSTSSFLEFLPALHAGLKPGLTGPVKLILDNHSVSTLLYYTNIGM
jgi:hypothetical protein